jgi:hypothetical protein
MQGLRRFLLGGLAIAFVLGISSPALRANSDGAKDPPADVCSLLTPAQLQKTMGAAFDPATKTEAPAAYRGQSPGTNCHYSEQKSGRRVAILIVYVDKSPEEAKQTFNKLSMWFPAKSKPTGIGDSAYIDNQHAIHVLKGKVRFFINISEPTDQKVEDLATAVAAQI